MEASESRWQAWHELFDRRKSRPMPQVDYARREPALPVSLAKSLAIFQLGESGGGTIIDQARSSELPATDQYYARAMALFVKEENRHADVLARCVRLLGGELIHKNWTARLFVFSRRLMGIRLKVVVLLAAEVVGLCYYHLLSKSLRPCQVRNLLSELVADEESHLYFHCDFLRSQATTGIRRVIFVIVWRVTMLASVFAVMLDHRAAIRDLNIDRRVIWRRWMSYANLAERLTVGTTADLDGIFEGFVEKQLAQIR